VRRGLYFGLQRSIGSRIGSVWRELQRWERLSPEALSDRVNVRLREVLENATSHSAYYRKLGLRVGHAAAADSLRRFPVLTREILRAEFSNIVVDSLRSEITSPASVARRRYDWLVVKTGGTTGNPTTVVHDARARDWGRATRLLSARLCGHPLGTRYFRLWGSEADLLQTEASTQMRALQGLLGYIPLNAFRAKEAELQRHYETIVQHPEIDSMMAYVDAAVSLALYIEDKGLPRPRLRTIMACAGTVTNEWREILQRVFQAEVFDKYGSRECCDMACECNRHHGLHVFSPNAFIEIVDDQGQPCRPGQTGRILVTLLNNASFPMIRYQIGDLGQWAEPGPCECRLAWPRIQSLQGRADDMLTTEDGTLLSSVFVRHFVGVSLNRQIIREWQLEQTERKSFVFRYVPVRTEGLSENLERIKNSFHLALGKSVTIALEQVTEIPPSPTGKVRWIINTTRTRKFNQGCS
jgi:phenylacetate-CoA ligase